MINDFDIAGFVSLIDHSCSKVQKKKFKKGEIITTYIYKYNQICILKSGSADLVRFDFYGNRTIIGRFNENEVFGGALYPASTNNELTVVAKKASEVIFFNYDDVLNGCPNKCKFHQYFSENLINLILSTVSKLNLHIELLSNRTIREKLLAYLNINCSKKLTKTIQISSSFTDLADYLSIDRSAMMRELKTLQDEGFIKKNGNRITLLY